MGLCKYKVIKSWLLYSVKKIQSWGIYMEGLDMCRGRGLKDKKTVTEW